MCRSKPPDRYSCKHVCRCRSLGQSVELEEVHKYFYSSMLTDRLFVEESVPHPSRCHYFWELILPVVPSLQLGPREYGYLQGHICSRLLQASVQRQLVTITCTSDHLSRPI